MTYISSQYPLVQLPADKISIQQPKAKLETRQTDFSDVAWQDRQQEGRSPSALNDSALEVLLQGGTWASTVPSRTRKISSILKTSSIWYMCSSGMCHD